MKIIIYGTTELGCLIATEFFEDHDITVIDDKENKADNFSKLDIEYIQGSASDIEVLKKADIKNADVFVACTDTDEVNIVACLTAKRISGVKTICFVSTRKYNASLGLTKDIEYPCDLYIDHLIWPEEFLTQEIFRTVTVEQALDVENFAEGKAKLLEYKIEENSLLAGKKVKECDFPEETLIVGIMRDEELFIPSGDTELKISDKVIFMGLNSSLNILAGKFFHQEGYVKTVTIIGGGDVGMMLAQNLAKTKIKTKIIELDTKRCEYLAQNLEETLVINGDGTNLVLLREEDITSSDVVVSVTNNDEKNLLCSLLVKQAGVKRVISRVMKTMNIPLFEKVGIDVAISADSTAIKEVRNDLYETNVDILATVEQGLGEVLEIKIPNNFKTVKILELKLPVRAIIGTIQRRHKVIIPKGNTLIMPDDALIIFTTSQNVPEIKKYFEGLK